jgi:hypothetical protein
MSCSSSNLNPEVRVIYKPDDLAHSYYKCDFIEFTTDGTTNWNTFTKSWPIDVTILLCEYAANSNIEIGDLATCMFDFGTLGSITQDVSVGDGDEVGKEINVSSSLDKENNKVLCENATTNAFNVSTPTFVKIQRYLIQDFPLEPGRSYDFGKVSLGSAVFPAGQVVTLKIKSTTATVKKGVIKLEIMY